MGVLFCLDRRTEGVQGARKATCLCRCTPTLPEGNPLRMHDAPTTAREQGLQPYGAFTLFFRWRKKSVQKKASGTATPGKRLLLPILTAGLAMSRAAELDCQHLRSCALVLTLILFQKGQGFFPPLPIAALLPRSWRWAGLPLAGILLPSQSAAGRLTH